MIALRVFNKYHGDAPETAVNVMRPSVLGNPFSHQNVPGTFHVATRELAVRCFEIYIEQMPELAVVARRLAHGRDLLCCCKPLPCHGDVLLRVINGDASIGAKMFCGCDAIGHEPDCEKGYFKRNA